jgi:hypothetical protein
MNRAKYAEFATDVMCNRSWPTSYNCIDYGGRKELKVHFKGHFTVSIHFVDSSTRYISQIHVDNTLFGSYTGWSRPAWVSCQTTSNRATCATGPASAATCRRASAGTAVVPGAALAGRQLDLIRASNKPTWRRCIVSPY